MSIPRVLAVWISIASCGAFGCGFDEATSGTQGLAECGTAGAHAPAEPSDGEAVIRVLRQEQIKDLTAEKASAAMAFVRGETEDAACYDALFEEVIVPSRSDAVELRGSVAEIYEGGELALYSFWDGIDGTNDGVHTETDAQYREKTVVSAPKRARLAEEPSNGDLRAEPGSSDFERLQILHHLDRAAVFLASVGYNASGGVKPLYYGPDGGVYRNGTYAVPQVEGVSNNAYYDQFVRFYWVAPGPTLFSGSEPSVPIYLRYSVVVHEYGHEVVDNIVDLDRESYRTAGKLTVRALNVYQALQEGVCDVFGGAATGDPDILGVGERNLDIAKEQTAELEAGLDMTPEHIDWYGLPDEHARGAVIAHALWVAGADDPLRLAAWSLAALSALREVVDEDPNLTYEAVMEAFVATAPSAWRSAVCDAFDATKLTQFHARPSGC